MMKRIICVLGNNDFYNKNYPDEIVCEIGGKRFFMCHGHKYNVKYGLFALKKKAKDLKDLIGIDNYIVQKNINPDRHSLRVCRSRILPYFHLHPL